MIQLYKNVLVIAAHPDDEILGVGGSIPLMIKQGCNVDVLIVTDGSSTQYINDEEILANKFKEAKAANDLIGARLLPHLDFPDMRLDTVAHVDLNIALNKVIQKGKYDTVFVQDSTDINCDHRHIFQSTMVVCRPYPGQKVNNLLSYYVNSSTEWGNMLNKVAFNPNVYMDITDTIEVKLQAMMAYKTEVRKYPHPRSIQGIKNSAEYFGNSIGVSFAEPFRLIFSKT